MTWGVNPRVIEGPRSPSIRLGRRPGRGDRSADRPGSPSGRLGDDPVRRPDDPRLENASDRGQEALAVFSGLRVHMLASDCMGVTGAGAAIAGIV